MWTWLVLVCLLTGPVLTADPGSAAGAYLRQHPGGVAIGPNEVSYDAGGFIVTVEPPPGPPVADCPSGWFCLYDRPRFGYPRARLSGCGWRDLATWDWADRPESAHYHLMSGAVVFLDHRSSPQHTDDSALFTVGAAVPTAAEVPGRANHVYRYC